MVYISFLLISILYFNIINQKKYNLNHFIVFYIPFVIIWVLIVGLQFSVGTDYESYLWVFDTGAISYKYRNEWLFYYLVTILKKYTNNGQYLFVFISIIQVILTLHILKKNKENGYILSLVFFYYLTISGIFFNQMNGIRQYVAVPFFVLSLFYFHESKKKSFLLIILGALFHQSILLLIPIFFLKKFFEKKYNYKFYMFYVITVFLLSIIGMKDILIYIIGVLIPRYSHYLENFGESLVLSKQIVKFLLVPIFIYSIKSIKSIDSKFSIYLFNIGFFSFFIFFIFAEIRILVRILDYFRFFYIFPFYFLTVDLLKKKKVFDLLIIISIVLFLFILKVVIFPVGEYEYQNVLFR